MVFSSGETILGGTCKAMSQLSFAMLLFDLYVLIARLITAHQIGIVRLKASGSLLPRFVASTKIIPLLFAAASTILRFKRRKEKFQVLAWPSVDLK